MRANAMLMMGNTGVAADTNAARLLKKHSLSARLPNQIFQLNRYGKISCIPDAGRDLRSLAAPLQRYS
jgi:hypothetical protein